MSDFSFSRISHHLVALIKYGVAIVLLVAAAKLLPAWLGGSVCYLSNEDDSMREALGRSRIKVAFDPNAWNETRFERGDIVIVNQEYKATSGMTRSNFPFRVVAVEGDLLQKNAGRLKVNNVDENYEGATIKTNRESGRSEPFRLPRGYLYALTDDRRSPMGGAPESIPAWRVVGRVIK